MDFGLGLDWFRTEAIAHRRQSWLPGNGLIWSQHLEGRSKWISVSSRPTWSTEWLPERPGLHKAKLCLQPNQTKPNSNLDEQRVKGLMLAQYGKCLSGFSLFQCYLRRSARPPLTILYHSVHINGELKGRSYPHIFDHLDFIRWTDWVGCLQIRVVTKWKAQVSHLCVFGHRK